MSKQDPMLDGPINANRMKFPEFLCFVCRLAHELHVGTQDELEMAGLHEKLDRLLPILLSSQGLAATFSFQNPDELSEESEVNSSNG